MNIINFLLGGMLVLTALFLILLVLIQRGKGGGLTGALGGGGGQSAFGTKAGDVFTRITVGVAGFWIALCLLSYNLLGKGKSPWDRSLGTDAPPVMTPQTPPPGTAPPSGEAPATGGKAPDGGDIQLVPSAPGEEATPAGETKPDTAPAPAEQATPTAPADQPPAPADAPAAPPPPEAAE